MKNLPKIHCRYLLLFFFHQSKGKISAFAATKKICDVYGNDTITEKTCQRWLKRFKEGNFDLNINNALEGREDSVFKILIQKSLRIQKPTPESWLLLSNAHQ